MATALPSFPTFDVSSESGAIETRWKKYVTHFWNLVVALNIKDKSRQKALLLHYAGEEVNDIFDTLLYTEEGEGEDPLEKTIDALTAYFQPKQNVAYEVYQFRLAKQEKDETLLTFYTRLKALGFDFRVHWCGQRD